MTSEKQLAANRRNALLSSGAGTRTGRRASAEQQFADLVADPRWFIRIAACEHRIRVAMRKNMRQLLDLQALRSAVLNAKTATSAKSEFAPDAQTSASENGFVFSNDQIARRPSPSQKAKVIPIDAYRPPRSPAAA